MCVQMSTSCYWHARTGMNQISEKQLNDAEKQFKVFESMINSMTPQERSNPDLLAKVSTQAQLSLPKHPDAAPLTGIGQSHAQPRGRWLARFTLLQDVFFLVMSLLQGGNGS